jgi:hypothetical protein
VQHLPWALLLLLGGCATLRPAAASPEIGFDTSSYPVQAPPGAGRGRVVVTVVLDAIDDIEIRTQIAGAMPANAPFAVAPRSASRAAELVGSTPPASLSPDRGVWTLRFDAPPSPGESVEAEVVERIPRNPGNEGRFALFVPALPVGQAAADFELRVEYDADAPPAIRPWLLSGAVGRRALPAGRERAFVHGRDIAVLPADVEFAGRVPGLLIADGSDPDAVAAEHGAVFGDAARVTGAVVRAAASVLAQPDTASAIREAALIAFGTVRRAEGPSSGVWARPAPADATIERGEGTGASRAALFVALLRAADIRAEWLLAAPRWFPDAYLDAAPLYERFVVLVRGGGPDGRDLFVDAEGSPSPLGVLPEHLRGGRGLLLGEGPARFLPLPAVPDSARFTLEATEQESGDFAVSLRGEVEGTAAGDLLAAEPGDQRRWSAWADALGPGLVVSSDGVRARLRWEGVVPRAAMLPGSRLLSPALPEPAAPVDAWRAPIARTTVPFSVDLLEAWTFRAGVPGGAPAPLDRVTPFSTIDGDAAWSGGVFTRRASIRWTGTEIPPAAGSAPEEFTRFLHDALGSVDAPAVPR